MRMNFILKIDDKLRAITVYFKGMRLKYVYLIIHIFLAWTIWIMIKRK